MNDDDTPPAADGPAAPRRQPGQRRADPLSLNTRRKLLAKLLAAAEAGDTAAAAALVELGLAAERDQQLGETLRQLRGTDTEGNV